MNNARMSLGDKLRGSNLQKSQSILEYLFTFLDTDEELNSVLSGYFSKVVDALFRKNPAKVKKLSMISVKMKLLYR